MHLVSNSKQTNKNNEETFGSINWDFREKKWTILNKKKLLRSAENSNFATFWNRYLTKKEKEIYITFGYDISN